MILLITITYKSVISIDMWCDSRLREEDNKLIKLDNIYADESNKCDNSISKNAYRAYQK